MPKDKSSLAVHFGNSYVSSLRNGDPDTHRHFATYFSQELDYWLRRRLRDASAIEDVRQETLCRVLQVILRGDGVRDADRLPQFVTGTCKNVLFEHWRAFRTLTELDESVDAIPAVDGPEQTVQTSKDLSQLRRALTQLPAQDRALLMMLYVDELDRSEVSRRMAVTRGHLRVLVHRAVTKLRALFRNCAGEHTIPALERVATSRIA